MSEEQNSNKGTKKKILAVLIILLIAASFICGYATTELIHKWQEEQQDKAEDNSNEEGNGTQQYYIKVMAVKSQLTVCISHEYETEGYIAFKQNGEYISGYLCGENVINTHFKHEAGNLVQYYVLFNISEEDINNMVIEDTPIKTDPIKITPMTG